MAATWPRRDWLMPFQKTQGIVVRKAHFSETSLILTFLTRDFGKIQTLAKGAKRCGKRTPGVLDLACLADIVFLQKAGELHTLTEWEVQDYFPGLRRALARLYAADYVAELVRDTTEQEPCQEIFDLMAKTLAGLAETSALASWIFAFEIKLLAALGYMPELSRCTVCSGGLTSQAFFSPSRGGAVCRACRRTASEPGEQSDRPDPLVPVSAGSIATIRNLGLAEFTRLDRFRIGRTSQGEIRRVIRRHIEYRIGRRPRLWRYLEPRTGANSK